MLGEMHDIVEQALKVSLLIE